jgi:hypothetical protein
MSQFFSSIAPLVILSGAQNSNVYNGLHVFSDSKSITIYSPATVAETIELWVNPDPEATAAGSGWVNLTTDGTTNITVPVASKARSYDISSVGAFKLRATGAVAADRTFKVTKNFVVTC